jgi:hypothetical protein
MAGPGTVTARARKREPKREAPFNRWFLGHVFSLLRRHGNALFSWTAVCYIVRRLSLAFISFAGKQSVADLGFTLAANISIVWTVSIAVSGLSITLYLRERKLHRRTRERLTARNIELELKIDPGRTSSLLTPKGLTRKGDE